MPWGMVDTSVKVKLRAKTPGGNAEVCEFQGAQGAAASPVRRSFSEGSSPPTTF